MGRPVVHGEFWSGIPQAVSEFYESVFGWRIRHLPELDDRLAGTGGEGGIDGGIMQPKAGPWPGKLAFSIDVDDLAASGRKIEQAGGKAIVDQRGVPGVGKLSFFEHPGGRVLGMWKKAARRIEMVGSRGDAIAGAAGRYRRSGAQRREARALG